MKKLGIILGLFLVFVCAQCAQAEYWNKNKINVYIPSKNSKANEMQRAFTEWQNKLKNRISFNFVTKGPADIDVVFEDNVSGPDGDIGMCSLSTNGDKIKKAEIHISNTSYKKYSNDLIYVVMLHEVGHAIGLTDTTGTSLGIMHTPIKEGQTIKPSSIRRLHAVYKNTPFLKTR